MNVCKKQASIYKTARALDKWVYLKIIFLSKLYVVTPHLNRLVETVQMRGHKICFYEELTKIITKYALLSTALCHEKVNQCNKFKEPLDRVFCIIKWLQMAK